MSPRRRVVVQRGDFDLDVDLEMAPATVVAVMGPNGAGKTSLLRALAGLEVGDASGLPSPGDVGIVFQDLRLFPHLSARDNVAFAHEARGHSRREARRLANADLERVGAAGFADRLPAELSGGEAQRVALARGLVGDPSLLLLDEPFASLDAAARQDLRRDLPSVLRTDRRCTVLVTHDPIDAMILADVLVVIEDGRVTHEGSVADIARHPRSAWAADLLGVNLVRGVGAAEGVVTTSGATVVCRDEVEPGVEVFARFDPSSVAVHTVRPTASSARNIWLGEVMGAEQVGARVRVDLGGEVPLVAELTAGSADRLGLVVGTRVWSEVKATEVTAYPVPLP
ncbi:MAG TPA: ABC transporter ATP-binding protein [Acidimicrobiales bacterium]|nr:ABC transporter ATP-binding protein [Acidimicrobiales bacterium]